MRNSICTRRIYQIDSKARTCRFISISEKSKPLMCAMCPFTIQFQVNMKSSSIMKTSLKFSEHSQVSPWSSTRYDVPLYTSESAHHTKAAHHITESHHYLSYTMCGVLWWETIVYRKFACFIDSLFNALIKIYFSGT